MKILFLTDNFPPEVNAPASRTYDHCIEWVKQGAQVTVITCAPNFPQGKLYAGYKNKWRQEEVIDGIRVIRVWTYITSNSGFLKRTLDYLSFCLTSFFHSLWIDTDLIVATSPQFFTAVGGYLSALVKRKPWVMEVRDLWPESIRAVNAMNKESRMLDWLEKLELHLYRKAKKIIVVTDAFKKNISNRGINPEKIFVVKNGVDLSLYHPLPKDEQLLEDLNLKGKFIVGYLGTHGMAHKLEFILSATQKVKNKNIHFLFIGGGSDKQRLLELSIALQLHNVTMLPPVLKSEVKRYISITDIALVPLKKSDTFKTVIPSKIFENAAMKKPILLGVEGEAQSIIEEYDAGVCFEPENEEDFLAQLEKIVNDKTLYNRKQLGCTNLANHFDRKKLAGNMLRVLEHV